jgi:hypothetical protein
LHYENREANYDLIAAFVEANGCTQLRSSSSNSRAICDAESKDFREDLRGGAPRPEVVDPNYVIAAKINETFLLPARSSK